MKRILGILFIIGLLFVSCEEELPIIPDCEMNKTGTVNVINKTGYPIYTDITWGVIVTNDEKFLVNKNSFKYEDIPSGSIEIWIKYDGKNWRWSGEHLSTCEDMTYTWYLVKDKPDDDLPFALDVGNGNLYTPTLKEIKLN